MKNRKLLGGCGALIAVSAALFCVAGAILNLVDPVPETGASPTRVRVVLPAAPALTPAALPTEPPTLPPPTATETAVPTESPTPEPTDSPVPAATLAPPAILEAQPVEPAEFPADTPTAAPLMEPAELPLNLVSLTSPAAQNSMATVVIETAPGASCSIEVVYKSGRSEADGLGPTAAGGDGRCSWTWQVGGRTTPGDWPIHVRVSLGDQRNSLSTSFTVQ